MNNVELKELNRQNLSQCKGVEMGDGDMILAWWHTLEGQGQADPWSSCASQPRQLVSLQ